MKGLGVKPDPLDKQQDTGWAIETRNTFGERDREEAQSKPESRPWRTYSRGASWRWLFKYVQVTIRYSYLYNYCVFSWYVLQLLISRNWFTLLIAVYFCRLKMNHDSHEFILESGTVANNNALFYCIYLWIYACI
jgi:hypothetical protein